MPISPVNWSQKCALASRDMSECQPMALPASESPETRLSLTDLAAREVRGRILSGAVRPGSVIAVHRLAPELGMSRTPVHEALKRLCAEGLLKVVPRVGYVVTRLTLEDLVETFQLRLVLEPFAAELAVRNATDLELREFARKAFPFQPAGRPVASDDPELPQLLAEVHDEFHLRVAALSGNRRLVASIRQLLIDSRQARVPHGPRLQREVKTGRVSGHVLLADALIARDVESAVKHMVEHVRMGQQVVLGALLDAGHSAHGHRRLNS